MLNGTEKKQAYLVQEEGGKTAPFVETTESALNINIQL